MAWTDLTFAFGSVLTSTQMTQLDDNFDALAAGGSGAPSIQTAALAASAVTTVKINAQAVTQAKIADAAVGQAQLITSSGNVSTSSTVGVILTLPGGAYGFYPELKADSISTSAAATIGGDKANPQLWGTTYTNYIVLTCGTIGTAFARQRYVNACPPYDLGDGEIGQFIFALIDNGTGNIEATYSAPEAPWHHNGPTDIRAHHYDETGKGWRKSEKKIIDWKGPTPILIDSEVSDIEVTQAIKQADMGLIPHPFIGNDLTGKTVVMLDPVADMTWHLAEMHRQGVPPCELLNAGYLKISNSHIKRAGPPGVTVVSYTWRA